MNDGCHHGTSELVKNLWHGMAAQADRLRASRSYVLGSGGACGDSGRSSELSVIHFRATAESV